MSNLTLVADRGTDEGYRPASGTLPQPAPESSIAWHWLAATLDELDYGTVLLGESGEVMHINYAAQVELDSDHPMTMSGNRLRVREAADAARFQDALRRAQRGMRHLVSLGSAEQRVNASVVPLPPTGSGDRRATLVVLGKRRVCEALSIDAFARSRRLTPAETRVLAALCGGTPPGDIAVEQGVAISTVRSQISSIRLKTESASIRQLVGQVALLPPLMGALRAAPRHLTLL